jgi:Asp/Glu/hydantoin racemase
MTRRVALIHGTPVVLELMEALVREHCPRVKVMNILDEALLSRLLRSIEITPEIRRDFCNLVVSAEKADADIALVTGSSFSPCVDTARELVSIPVLKIDEAMAEESVALGPRIGLMATELTTIGPSTSLIKQKASELGKEVVITVEHCPGAFELLRTGRLAEFDEAIAARAQKVANDVDVLVFAQASMARAIPLTRERVSIPVVSSPELAAKRLAAALAKLDGKSDA